jgi:hypothetical protein
MEFLGNINSVYSLIAFVIFYGVTEICKWQGKKKNSAKRSAESLDKISLQIKRLEMLNMIQHAPTKRTAIERIYDEYKSLGGNSYVDDVYDEWREKRVKGKG